MKITDKNYDKIKFRFNQYTGNFSREFCAYVLGYSYPDSHERIDKLSERAGLELGENKVDRMLELIEIQYRDYAREDICELTDHKKDAGPLGITLRVNPKFTEKYLNLITQRAKDFLGVIENLWKFAPADVKLKKVKVETFEVKKIKEETIKI